MGARPVILLLLRDLGFVRRCGCLQGCGCAARIVGTADAAGCRGGDAHRDAADCQHQDTQDVREEVGFPVVCHAFYCSMEDAESARNIITFFLFGPPDPPLTRGPGG